MSYTLKCDPGHQMIARFPVMTSEFQVEIERIKKKYTSPAKSTHFKGICKKPTLILSTDILSSRHFMEDWAQGNTNHNMMLCL